MRSIFAAIIMLSASTAPVHAAAAENHASAYGYMQAPVDHRQPTQHDVTGADQVRPDQKIAKKDNEPVKRPPTPDDVTGADQSKSDDGALTKMIDEENARLDRLVRSICRGC